MPGWTFDGLDGLEMDLIMARKRGEQPWPQNIICGACGGQGRTWQKRAGGGGEWVPCGPCDSSGRIRTR